MKDLHKKLPGLLACLAVAVPAWLLGKQVAVAGSAVFCAQNPVEEVDILKNC